MGLLNTIKSATERLLRPPATVVTGRHEPDSMIEWMDVDRVGLVLRASKGGCTQQLFALYRDIILTDSHIQTEFTKRKLAVLGDTFRVLPWNRKVPEDVRAAALCEQNVWRVERFLNVCSHLMDGALWPISVVEKVFVSDGETFHLHELVPVPHHLLDFTEGRLRVRATDAGGQPINDFHDPDPDRYITHRGHLLSAPDHLGGPMRSLIFWWLASTMNREWWVRFLDRYGTPFMVGKYEASNTQDRNIILAAFSAARKVFGLAVSKNTEVEIIEASKAGAECYERFIAVCQREKSKLILGQTLSSQTDATGQGSGVADLQAEVRDDFRRMDANLLGMTLRDQLFKQICAINRMPGKAPTIVWGAASTAELKAKADLLTSLGSAGLEVDDAAIETLTDEVGFGLRRKLAPPAEVGLPLPFSSAQLGAVRDRRPAGVRAVDGIALKRSAKLARGFRERHADLLRLVIESNTPDNAAAALAARVQERIESGGVFESALVAAAANGAARSIG